jgi:signal peptidase I
MSSEAPLSEAGSIPAGVSFLTPLPRPGSHTPGFLYTTGQWLGLAALAMASYIAVSHFVVQSVRVSGVSMRPTLNESELYLLNRWVFHMRAPQPNEIVVLRDPEDKKYSVKRIIGCEGDVIRLEGGKVFVNGTRLYEPYLFPKTLTFPVPFSKAVSFICRKDQYFVLGDNRNYSLDSRSYGLVQRSDILGLVVR